MKPQTYTFCVFLFFGNLTDQNAKEEKENAEWKVLLNPFMSLKPNIWFNSSYPISSQRCSHRHLLTFLNNLHPL